MFCTSCGKKVPYKTDVCPFCDAQILTEEDEVQENEAGAGPENDDGSDQSNLKENFETYENSQYNPDAQYESCVCGELAYSKCDTPLSTASFFFMQIVLLIPVVNLLLLLIWSFGKNTNSNRRSYARSMLIWFLSFSVIALFAVITMIFMRYPIDLGFWFSEFRSFINSIPGF